MSVARITICVVVSLALIYNALGDEASQPDLVQSARNLVAKLESPNYAERESAAESLLKLGEDARPALENALKNPHAETRLRVQRILARIEQGDLQRRIDAFLTSEEPDAGKDLPGWPRLEKIIGDGRTQREFYVEMLRAEGDLLSATANSPRSAASSFHLRCQQLQVESSSQSREIERPSLAAVLFVAANDSIPMIPGTDSLLYRFCSHSSVENVLSTPGNDSPMRKIVGAWISSGRGGYYSLRLAMKHELPEGLDAAERMLSGDTPAYYRQYAILTYANLGDKSNIARLMKLLTDATVCTTHRVNNETYQTQFRDIALVAVLHLAGYDPEMFGFERIRKHSEYVYSPYTLGFKSEEDRKAAFAMWEKIRPAVEHDPASE